MKKIRLNSGKLKLKKESIGNLLSKETMKNAMGGKTETGASPCTNYTQGCPSSPPQCNSLNCSFGCPPSADCTRQASCGVQYTCDYYCTATCTGVPGC